MANIGIQINKIVAIVTDNGENIVSAVNEAFGYNKHLPCFKHTLKLVGTKWHRMIDINKGLLLSVKGIVSYFKHSEVNADELKKAQSGTVDSNTLEFHILYGRKIHSVEESH